MDMTVKRKSQVRLLIGQLGRLATSSTSLVAGSAFAFSGGAFAIGNILLARHMPVAEFGRFGLAAALFLIFSQVAPLGIDQLFLRRRIDPSLALFGQLLGQGALTALVVGLLAYILYDLHLDSIILLSVAVITGGLRSTVSAGYRSHHKRLGALAVQTSTDWILLATGALALIVPMSRAIVPLSLYCGAAALTGVIVWARYAHEFRVPLHEREPISLQAAAPLFGIAVGGVIMVQLERIVIPVLLDVYALALFNVLTSVAIFPFRMMSSGAGFALVPRLRAATNPGDRQRLIWDELRMIGLALAGATVLITVLAPSVARWLTADRYELALPLVLAACLNGAAKVVQMIPRAIVTACGSERDVAVLNQLVWAGILASTAGAVIGSHAGLTGLLVGSALGNLVIAIPSSRMARRTIVADPTPG